MDLSQYSDEELEKIAGGGKPSSMLDKLGNYAGRFNELVESTHIPDFAGGLLQGAGDIGASIGNLVARPLGHPIPHPNLKQYIKPSMGSNIAFGAGELASQLPLYSSGAGLIGRATGIGSKAGLSGEALQGAISGGLLGENEEGSRLGGAVTGAAMPIAAAAIKKGLSFRSKNIANKVTETMKHIEHEYSNKFNHVFKEAEHRGYAGDYLPIKYDAKLLNKGGKKDFLYALEQYNKKPSLQAAHEAQSQLGKYVAEIGKPVSTLEKHAIREAKDLGKDLRSHIVKQLDKSGNVDLALKYLDARKGYKQEYVPYLESKTIQKLLGKKSLPSDFAKNIAQEKEFITRAGRHRHPEIQQRELVRKLITSKAGQYGIGTALGGAGLYGLSKLFK